MIAVSPGLRTLLTSGAFARADLYSITPAAQPTTTWTSANVDITVAGLTYASTGAHFERGRLKLARGLEVDTLELTISVDDAREPSINGVALRQAAQKGLLDGAVVALDWCYLSSWGPPVAVAGVLKRFSGRAGAIDVSRSGIHMTVNSWLVLLNAKVPSQIYAASCRFSLGDGDCGVALDAHSDAGIVGDGATNTRLPCQLAGDDGVWDGGWIRFTSGACQGVGRAVRTWSQGVLRLTGPLPWAPAAGDTFLIYPGCDKTMPAADNGASCHRRFANAERFGGTPFIPVPETAY